jgi:hypothetical protein
MPSRRTKRFPDICKEIKIISDTIFSKNGEDVKASRSLEAMLLRHEP